MTEPDWTAPGAYPVIDGVYRIPLPLPNDGLRAVNVYAIVDGDGLVLIDGGMSVVNALEQFERSLAEIECKLADIRRFLVTHAHRDHYTQAITVRRLHGSHVSIGAGERASIEALVDPAHTPRAAYYRRMIAAGAGDLIASLRQAADAAGEPKLEWGLPDAWLTPGQVTLNSRVLDVVETPGHTAGHVVFHDLAAQALFAGDHVLPRITPSIGLEPGPSVLPLAAYLDSLRLVGSMPDARLLPAHGPVTDSVHDRVEALLAHHEKRLTESAAAIEGGADTAYDVAKILRWTRHEKTLDELDIFNRTMAIGETRVHLDVCVMRGWLTSSEDADSVLHYQRA